MKDDVVTNVVGTNAVVCTVKSANPIAPLTFNEPVIVVEPLTFNEPVIVVLPIMFNAFFGIEKALIARTLLDTVLEDAS